MRITQALIAEHALLHRLLDRCAAGVHGWNLAQTQEAAAELAARLLRHTRREEEMLFSQLAPYIPAQAGPLAVAHLEHGEIADSLARIPTQQDVEGARLLLRYAVEVTRQHLANEERSLFPLAERCLGAEALERLGDRFAARPAAAFV